MAPRTESTNILIIGGGLSGIYAAYLLSRQKKSYILLEARNRIGGRILCSEYRGFFSDLGPTWYWPDIQPKIAALIRTLGLEGFRQFEEGISCFQRSGGSVFAFRTAPMEPACWRLSGGMITLIEKLSETIPENALRMG